MVKWTNCCSFLLSINRNNGSKWELSETDNYSLDNKSIYHSGVIKSRLWQTMTEYCSCISLIMSFFLSLSYFALQEFSLLRLDDVADQRVNIVGFSVFNKTHPFFQDFVLSLNRSWQENCDHAPFAGTPVSSHNMHTITQWKQKVIHVRIMEEPTYLLSLPRANNSFWDFTPSGIMQHLKFPN